MKYTSLRSRASVAGYAFVAGTLFGIAGTGIGAGVLGSAMFSDVTGGAYYDEAVGELYNDGVLKGYDGTNRFGPDDYVTRGQVAVMLKRFKDDMNGIGQDNDDSSSSRSRSSRSSSSDSSSSASSNNPKGTLRFTTSGFSINENQSKITVSVIRVGGDQGEVSVEYEVSAGTATAGSDFEEASGKLTFEDEEASKTFTIQLTDDSSSEGDETIILTLSSPSGGASVGSPSTATLTIDDNEASTGSSSSSGGNTSAESGKGTLSFSAATYMVSETEGSITITVMRTGGSSGTVGVNYATGNGSAQTNADYTPTSGTLSFGAGETSKTFSVPVVDDSSLSGNATFSVALSAASGGAGLGQATAVVSIHDNENTAAAFGTGSLKFDKSSYTVTESDKEVTVTVQRVGGAKGTVTVSYATVNGTAFSGADYTATSGTLTFLPGETGKTITIPVVDDNNAEAQDNFYVNLSSPSSNSALLSPNSTTVTISG